MSTITPREERARNARRLLETDVDAWVASASADGDAYMVPLSYFWDGVSMLFATPTKSRTVRDLRRARRTRVALGSTRDVVILDGVVIEVDPSADNPAIEAFVVAAKWDPREESDPYSWLRFTPERIQAWRSAAELATRDVMRGGRWLDLEPNQV